MEKLSPYEEQEFQRLVKSAKAETMAYYEKYNNMQKQAGFVKNSDTVTKENACEKQNINNNFANNSSMENNGKTICDTVSAANMKTDCNCKDMPKSSILNNIFSRLDTEALLILAIAMLLYKENADTLTILVLIYIALG